MISAILIVWGSAAIGSGFGYAAGHVQDGQPIPILKTAGVAIFWPLIWLWVGKDIFRNC